MKNKDTTRTGPFVTAVAHAVADPFRLLIESVVDYAIIMLDPAGRITSWNPGVERIYGYSAEAILEQPISVLYTPDDAADLRPQRMLQRALQDSHYEFECLRKRRDGSLFHAIVTLSDVRDHFGIHTGFAEVTRDITDYREAEQALRSERDLSTAMLNSLPGVYYMYDESGRFLRWNQRFEEVTEYSASEIAQLHPLDLFEGADKDLLAQRIASVFQNGRDEVEADFVTKSGKRIPYYFNGVRQEVDGVRCLLGMGIDISKQRKAQQELRESDKRLQQAQKMEAIGQLAGGVAHDFNNLLTVINGYSEELLEQVGTQSPLHKPLFQIHQAGDRAQVLTRQLLAFGRKQVMNPRQLNLNDVVKGFESMLRRLLGESILLELSLDAQIGAVLADPAQMEQILLNLAVNARDAMPGGGRLMIETRNTALDAGYCAAFADLTPGPFVLLAVSDTGAGISDADKPHIFEPFFTTKDTGKGTGLGLSTVHGIVKQSHGHVAAYSELGRGSCFKVYLPLHAASAQPAEPLPESQTMPSGTEAILLVEDEEAVRSLASAVLQNCGYRVTTACDGREACALVRDGNQRFDLLVSDVVMPYVGGRELAQTVRALQPHCRVLFLSGYADDAVIRHGVIQAEFAFLQKPFSLSSLARKVRAVLDGPPPAAPKGGNE